MFVPLEKAPEASGGRTVDFRRSLNAPVVASPEGRFEQASARISFRENPAGDPELLVSLRPLEGGSTRAFRFTGPLTSPKQREAGLEAAEFFLEGLGFLFDPGAPSEAPVLWGPSPEGPVLPATSRLESESVLPDAAAVRATPTPDRPRPVLTKFRRDGGLARSTPKRPAEAKTWMDKARSWLRFSFFPPS